MSYSDKLPQSRRMLTAGMLRAPAARPDWVSRMRFFKQRRPGHYRIIYCKMSISAGWSQGPRRLRIGGEALFRLVPGTIIPQDRERFTELR